MCRLQELPCSEASCLCPCISFLTNMCGFEDLVITQKLSHHISWNLGIPSSTMLKKQRWQKVQGSCAHSNWKWFWHVCNDILRPFCHTQLPEDRYWCKIAHCVKQSCQLPGGHWRCFKFATDPLATLVCTAFCYCGVSASPLDCIVFCVEGRYFIWWSFQ